MGSEIDRLEIDRRLFERGVRDQLRDLVGITNAGTLSKAIVKVIELQVATEELALSKGLDVSKESLGQIIGKDQSYFIEQVDRAITKFIGSIYSQEG